MLDSERVGTDFVAFKLEDGALVSAAEYAHQTVNRAVSGARPAAEWLDEQAKALNETQKKLVSSTRNYVTANPLKSLGIALAAGFLVSRFIRK